MPIRLLLGLLAFSLTSLALAQKREGNYVPVVGGVAAKTGTAWSLNENHALIWGGTPYLPVGLRIDGSPEAVRAAKGAGIKDVLVDLPAGGEGWSETLAALRTADMRFLIRVNSLAPMARGFAVEPDAYRIDGITQPRTVTVDLPGATSAFVVLAAGRDSSITHSERVPVVDGKLTYDVTLAGQLEHVLLIYPEMDSIEQPDFWDGMDIQRDDLLASLKRYGPGPGLRGIVNPMGRTLGLPGRELEFVPTSPYFRMELSDLLEARYKSVSTATRSWGIGTNDLETFDDLARLVPLWHGTRGVGLLLDPVTNRTYTCDKVHSSAWIDLSAAVTAAGIRRFQRLVAAVRSVADVPVTQEWAGWSAPYESADPPVDGIGMRTSGTSPSALISSGCRATSSVLRWMPRGWLLATDVDLGPGAGVAPQLEKVLDDLGELGARGFFVRSDAPDVVKAVAAESGRRSADTSLASSSTDAVYFPENAMNPASPQRLPGGKWWLPTPADGNRIDLGSFFWGYEMATKAGSTYVLWAKQSGKCLLRMTNPKNAIFTSVDGHDPSPKFIKGGVNVELTQYPLIVTGIEDAPIPQIAFIETVVKFDALMAYAGKTLKDITQERVFFHDFATGFDRSPGGNFPEMRGQLQALGAKIGDTTILEAERSLDQNFSAAAVVPGCSANGALLLRTPFPPGPEGYYANFSFQVKTRADQEVWLAAAIPPERRAEVQVTVNGQLMTLNAPPVSLYGDGYGWYKLGVTRLSGGVARARIQVNGAGGAPIALDVLLLTPRPFTPDGITLPDPIQYPNLNFKDANPTQKKKSKGGLPGILGGLFGGG